MNSFLNYILESGVSLGMLSLVYFLFLRKETFYRANRLFLLFAVVFSSILPLLHFKIYGAGNVLLANTGGQSNMLETITVNAPGFSHSLIDLISTNQLLLLAYFGGSCVIALRFLFRIGQILRVIRKGNVVPKSGIKFVYTEGNSSPYSFGNYLFVSKDLENHPGWEKMLAHESEHIRQGHTVDILLLELISIFQWFNPFFWLLRRVIKENHEFMADRAVLNNGVAVDLYKQVLVSQYVGHQFSMANNFNSSLIKTRLKMMTKIKSSKTARFRFLSAGIMAIALLLVFACENRDVTNIKWTGDGSPVKTVRVDSQLVLINGQFSTQETLLKLDPQTIESIHVFDANDQDMNQKYGQNAKNGVIDVKLKSVAADSTANSSGSAHVSFTGKTKVANDPAYENVSEMPVYPGGFAGLRKFIRETVRYPLDAQEQGIQGKVFVGFVVEKDGSVGRIKLARGVDPTLDVEALKVVSQMPRWTPGKMDGKNVAVSYTIPISFILQ